MDIWDLATGVMALGLGKFLMSACFMRMTTHVPRHFLRISSKSSVANLTRPQVFLLLKSKTLNQLQLILVASLGEIIPNAGFSARDNIKT